MPDSLDRLRKVVFAELKKQQTRADAAAQSGRVRQFGAFLDVCLSNLGRSHADFARELNIERELAEAVLSGLLPESEIDDGFLVEIAAAVQYEPNILRVMLGRAIKPTLHKEDV